MYSRLVRIVKFIFSLFNLEVRKIQKKATYPLDPNYEIRVPASTKNFKVIGVTPAGRKRYLEILVPYLLQQRGQLREHHFWLNTENAEDISYIKEVCKKYPDFFKYVESRIPINGIYSIHHFFKYYQDPNTIYVRFDDDVCYVHPKAVEELVKFRIENPQPFLVFGNIINNPDISWFHQKSGIIPASFGVAPIHDKALYVVSGEFAEKVHELFLSRLASGNLDAYKFNKLVMTEYSRFSINFLAWFGSDFAKFNAEVGEDEELWLTTTKSRDLARPNVAVGTALVAHFAFGHQRPYLESKTKLLERYKELSDRI